MERFRVHFVTLASLDLRLKKDFRYVSVLNDEAAQCPEVETLAAVLRVAGRLFLVGDHKQLCCLPKSKVAAEAGLEMSLFERLFEDLAGCPAVTLAQQYRMRSPLCEWISRRFYKDVLYCSPSAMSQACPAFFAMA